MPEARTTVAVLAENRRLRARLEALVDGSPGLVLGGVHARPHELDSNPSPSPSPSPSPGARIVVFALAGERYPAQAVGDVVARVARSKLLALIGRDQTAHALAVLQAGAHGCLYDDAPPVRLLEAIADVAVGGVPLSPELGLVLLEALPRPPAEAPALASAPRLSQRERQMLELLSSGHSYKTAAAALGVSLDTVRFHVRKLYDKLDVHSKVEAVVKASRAGWVG